jgi:hypothetical protein
VDGVMRNIAIYCIIFAMFAPMGFVFEASSATREAQVRLKLQIDPQELGELKETLLNFSKSEGFLMKDQESKMPRKDGRGIFYVQLFKSNSIKITLLNVENVNVVDVWFYELVHTAEFENEVLKLESTIRNRWQHLDSYHGP